MPIRINTKKQTLVSVILETPAIILELDRLAILNDNLCDADKPFKDILTAGTALYKHWYELIDSIAMYLEKLHDAHVPKIKWKTSSNF